MALSKPKQSSVELSGVNVEEEVLGRGSYGVVYKVTLKDGKKAAGKELHDFLSKGGGTKHVRDRFMQECQFLKDIEHSNIVRFYGVYYRSPKARGPMLIMELMRTSLDKWLTEDPHGVASFEFLPPFSDNLKLRILNEIVQGLAYIHNKDLVHRDLTAKNILISMAAEPNVVIAKIADFGVAKIIANSDYTTAHTTCPGTACYMPSEAKMDQPHYDSSLDIFSLGVVMLFMFTGELPESHPRKELRRIRDHSNPEISRKFLLIERCLSKNPKLRPASEMIEDELNGGESSLQPSWTCKNPGLNIQGICENDCECIAHGQDVICSIESEHFDLAKDSPSIKCPSCNSRVDPVRYILYQCSWELSGRKWVSFSQPPECYDDDGEACGILENEPLEHQREGNWLQLTIDTVSCH